LFVELANSRIASLEAEAIEREKTKANAAAEERIRNTHLFDVNDEGRGDGTLTVAPGTLLFEPKKANPSRTMTIQCSQIKRVESGKSALQPPHVNLYLTSPATMGDGKVKKDDVIIFWTSSGGQGFPRKQTTGRHNRKRAQRDHRCLQDGSDKLTVNRPAQARRVSKNINLVHEDLVSLTCFSVYSDFGAAHLSRADQSVDASTHPGLKVIGLNQTGRTRDRKRDLCQRPGFEEPAERCARHGGNAYGSRI
jgi:hypothetical protein